MLWIIGLGEIIPHALRLVPKGSFLYNPMKIASEQLEHASWAGLHFEDLIYPLFLYFLGLMATHGFDQPFHGFAGQTRQVHAITILRVI